MMRLPEFDYYAPKEAAEAVRIMAGCGGEGMFVAGGTDLYPNMKRRQQTPATVVSVMRIGELHGIRRESDGSVVIGAAVSLSELCRNQELGETHQVVSEAARLISTPLLRNMGTIGGNLLLDTRCNYYDQNYEWRRGINFCLKKDGDTCWVAPGSRKCWAVQSSDLAPVMVALGAKVKLVSPEGERLVDIAELYNNDGISYLHKRPDEMLAEVHLPPPNGTRAVYRKLRRRGSFDFPVLGVAVAVVKASGGEVTSARLVLGGVAPAPVEVSEAESILIGRKLDDGSISEAAEAVYLKARPLDNTDFLMNWRKQMARPFTARALADLM